MLEKMRSYATGWVAQVLIALLVLSFAVWGVSDIFRNFSSDTIAKVGKTEIARVQFENEYRRAVALQSQNSIPTPEQQQAIAGRVLGQMVTTAVLQDYAARAGLSVSDDAIRLRVFDDPTFRGASGTFDPNRFRALLSQMGLSEGGYIAARRDNEINQQLAAGLAGAITAPETYRRALHEYQDETRNVRYVVLSPDKAGDVGAPTPEQLATFFEAHKAEYAAPETRQIATLTLSPALVARPDEITAADVQADYDSNKALYTTAESRHIKQFIFPDKAAADAAAAKLASGVTFDELEADGTIKPTDIGSVQKSAMLDPVLADAAFGVAQGESTGIVQGRFGPAIAKVEAITPETVKPLTEVQDEIRRHLAETAAASRIAELRDQIEDARAGGDTLAKIAADIPGLTAGLKTVTVDASGKDEDGNPVPDIPGGQDLVTQAFESDVGLSNAPLEPAVSTYLWYDVEAVNAAHERTLDEVRDRVVAAWTKDAVAGKLAELARQMADKIQAGESIESVADAQGVTVESANDLKRSSTPTETLSAAAIAAAFAGPKDHVTTATGVDPASLIVVQVADVTLSPYFSGAPDAAALEAQLGQTLGNDLLQEYVQDLQGKAGVSINDALVQQVVGSAG